MPRISSAKGASYERSVCNRLSMWVSEFTREDVFWRSAMSGGRATLRAKQGRSTTFTAQSGDICATHQLGHLLLSKFVVECKCWKDIEAGRLVFGRKGKVPMFWQQVCTEADRDNRWPMLIVKQNRQPELVCVPRDGYRWLARATERGTFVPTCVIPRLRGMRIVLLRDLFADVEFSVLRPVRKSKRKRLR